MQKSVEELMVVEELKVTKEHNKILRQKLINLLLNQKK